MGDWLRAFLKWMLGEDKIEVQLESVSDSTTGICPYCDKQAETGNYAYTWILTDQKDGGPNEGRVADFLIFHSACYLRFTRDCAQMIKRQKRHRLKGKHEDNRSIKEN